MQQKSVGRQYITRLSLLGLAAVIECIGTRPTNIGHWTLWNTVFNREKLHTQPSLIITVLSEFIFLHDCCLAASLKSYCAHLTKANID